jgi:hypothetical protein
VADHVSLNFMPSEQVEQGRHDGVAPVQEEITPIRIFPPLSPSPTADGVLPLASCHGAPRIRTLSLLRATHDAWQTPSRAETTTILSNPKSTRPRPEEATGKVMACPVPWMVLVTTTEGLAARDLGKATLWTGVHTRVIS